MTISPVHDLGSLLPYGAAARQEVALAASASSVARWTAEGDLVHLHPGVVVLTERADEPLVRARAAALWAKGPLSHLSALWLWGSISVLAAPVHVTVGCGRFPRGTAGVVVHRAGQRPPSTVVQGLPSTYLARSLVDGWRWAAAKRARASDMAAVRQGVIEAVRDRGVSLAGLRAESTACGAHAGKAALRELVGLLGDGCKSELEIWGVRHVLPGPPAIPRWIQQYRVRLATGRWIELDAAYPEACVAVELDGAAFHGSRAARERDLRRDTGMAALGWVVLRFSYARLMSDPEECRREIEAVVRRRLAQR